MRTIYAGSAVAAANYYTRYLTDSPGEVPGVWSGRQADELGLLGQVEGADLLALLEGRDPITGTRLGRAFRDCHRANGRDCRALGPDRQPRAIAYGVPRGDGTDEELWIEIGRANVGTPDESFTVGEVVWSIERPEDSWWSASTRVGGTDLNVRGSGTFEEVLAGLTVVDESNLPFTPLGSPDDAVVVARTNVDGDIYTYSVQESGRYKCDWVTSQDGASGGCGSLVPSDADVTIDAGVTIEPGALPGTVDAVRSGSVTAATASVEVVFADGTTVTVEPTDLSGTLDRLFWIAAATISTDSQTELPVTQESVAEVRAYNRAGILIGTTVPLGLEQQGEKPSTDEP